MSEKTTLTTFNVMNLFNIFELTGLNIPDYQRPYTWHTSHVKDLLNDVFGRKTAYLMGTIILHEHDETLDIVDGQQRLVTLTMLCNELFKEKPLPLPLPLPLLEKTLQNASHPYIQANKKCIAEFLNTKSVAEKEALRKYFEIKNDANGLLFNVLTLSGGNALDRAYTFFDSVNSKGKPLSDFDLLKAHHLSFIPDHQENLAKLHNDEWQARDSEHSHLFSILLRRLRLWSRGLERDSRESRPDFNEFSSIVEPEKTFDGEHQFNRYMQPAAFHSWRRVGDEIVLRMERMDYPAKDGESIMPMAVTQSIEGGDSFFLFAKRYHLLYEKMFDPKKSDQSKNIALSPSIGFARKLGVSIPNEYIRNSYQAIMLLYFDKFNENNLIEVSVCVELTLSQLRYDKGRDRVTLESALTHVKEKNIIPIILEAVNPRHVVGRLINQSSINNSDEPETGKKREYYDSLSSFYRSAISQCNNIDVVSNIKSIYKEINDAK